MELRWGHPERPHLETTPEEGEGFWLESNENLGGRPELPDSRLGARGRDSLRGFFVGLRQKRAAWSAIRACE